MFNTKDALKIDSEGCKWPRAVHILMTESTFDWQDSQPLMVNLPTCTNYLESPICYAGFNIYPFALPNTDSVVNRPGFCNYLMTVYSVDCLEQNERTEAVKDKTTLPCLDRLCYESISQSYKKQWMNEWIERAFSLPADAQTSCWRSGAEKKTTPTQLELPPSPAGKISGSPRRTTRICRNQGVPGDWSGRNNWRLRARNHFQ